MRSILKNSFALLLLLASLFAYSQTDDQNHRKYWYYRSRFLNDFIKVGLNAGESLPMNERDALAQGNKFAKWGDVTSYLGYYLGVLSTEYYLLKQNNQATDSVRHELCCALYAFNRLDLLAEDAYHSTSSLNGFFVRDDVHSDFLPNNLKHFNYGLNLNPPQQTGFASNSFINTANKSDYIDFVENGQNAQNFPMSTDQVSDLFVGLGLISQLVDASAKDPDPNFKFQDNETSILSEARAITDRITNFVMSYPNWIIKNPVNGNSLTQGRGDFAFFSFPMAQGACRITNQSSVQFTPYTLCTNYNDLFDRTVGFTAWFALRALPFPGSSVGNAVIKGNYQAVANADYLLPFTGLVNMTYYYMYPNSTTWDIDWQTLLRQVLYGGPNLVGHNFYENILNDAPCVGPYYYNNPLNYANIDWFCTDRLEHPPFGNNLQAPIHSGTNGEYKGIDYMLYHNLYYIVKSNKYVGPVDLSDRFIQQNFPVHHQNFHYGDHQNPLTIGAFETIIADNKIIATGNYPSDGDVTYRAGKEITLKPGFEAQYGSDFHAYIKRYTCDQNGNYIRQAGDTGSNGCADCYTNEDMYNQPTSYVYYDHSDDPIRPEYTEEPIVFDPSNFTQGITADTLKYGAQSLVVFPSPNNGQFNIGITGLLEGESFANIYVVDMLGNEAFKLENIKDFSEAFMVDISGKAKGIYYVRMITDTGRNETVKVLVQ